MMLSASFLHFFVKTYHGTSPPKNCLQKSHGKCRDQANFPQCRQLESHQTRNGQPKHHDVRDEIQHSVGTKHGLLAAAVSTRQSQVPVGLNRLANQHGTQDARGREQTDRDARQLGDGGEARDRKDLDVQDEQRHFRQADAQRPECLQRQRDLRGPKKVLLVPPWSTTTSCCPKLQDR